jgi:hypothetical protein
VRSSRGHVSVMSASAPDTEPCAACGAATPPLARFCPECGTPLGEDLPGEIAMQRAEPRWFGVPPPALVLGVAAALALVGLVLFATGRWPYGLIAIGAAILFVAAFLEALRRRPGATGGQLGGRARERAGSLLEEWRVRAAAAGEVRRLQAALGRVGGEREGAYGALGRAVYGGDAEAEAAARDRLAILDRGEALLRRELAEHVEAADERIRKARLAVADTMLVAPPEPTPPPDEGNPPEPAIVPEPYPPPDEGTPPEPARVPEPGPVRDPNPSGS